MKRFIPLFLALTFLVVSPAYAGPTAKGNSSVTIPGGPTFWVHSVDRDVSITIKGENFPKDGRYRVRIGRPGNAFGAGEFVGFLTSPGSTFNKTYKIPDKFRGQTNLALLIDDPDDGSHGYLIFSNTDGYDSGQLISLIPVHHSSSQTNGTSVAIFNGPTYWIGDVKKGVSFTIRVVDYFDTDTYSVLLDENTSNFRGIYVGQINARDGVRFTKTFQIPASLANKTEIKVVVQNIFNGHSGSTAFSNLTNWFTISPAGVYSEFFIQLAASGSQSSYRGTPYTNIINVVRDGEVTLQTFNFPADTDFVVTMGPVGTKGVGGTVIGTQNSGTGGSFIATYAIPSQVRGLDIISIRLQSVSSKHFAYDGFQNEDGYGSNNTAATFNSNYTLPAGIYPSTFVTAVVADNSVTISGSNFTRNDIYTVKMGALGTQGVNGFTVGTVPIDSNGAFKATFSIPLEMLGTPQIAIRFESNNTAYYAYDWFWNTTSP